MLPLSKTGVAGVVVLSSMAGMRPFGLIARKESFFWSCLSKEMEVVLYSSPSSSNRMEILCPFGLGSRVSGHGRHRLRPGVDLGADLRAGGEEVNRRLGSRHCREMSGDRGESLHPEISFL